MKKRVLIGAGSAAIIQVLALLGIFSSFDSHPHEAEPAKHKYGKEEWANPKAKIDAKTGNGTPWTIVWDKRGNYDYTRKDGKRKHPEAAGVDRSRYPDVPGYDFLRITGLYGSYGDAAMAMLDEQRDEAGRWAAAPLPTAQPLAHNSPSPSPTPAAQFTAASIVWTTLSGTSTALSASPTPKPFATPIRIYERDQAENWMSVFQLDQNADKSWAHDNVKIETRAKPFVKPNKLTGGWTIDFVEKPR